MVRSPSCFTAIKPRLISVEFSTLKLLSALSKKRSFPTLICRLVNRLRARRYVARFITPFVTRSSVMNFCKSRCNIAAPSNISAPERDRRGVFLGVNPPTHAPDMKFYHCFFIINVNRDGFRGWMFCLDWSQRA